MIDLKQLQKELIGGDKFTENLSMLSRERLEHLEIILKQFQDEAIAGDIIETGCWRGGACIYMRAILENLGEPSRVVYAADSFEGVPKPNLERYPIDAYSTHWSSDWLKAPVEGVREAFRRYGYLDDRTVILKGWFKDTIPGLKSRSRRWCLLRLDGDIYESTIQVLDALYDDLVPGGYVVIDDFGTDVGAAHATRDFLHKIGRIAPPAKETGKACGCGTFGCFAGSPFHPGQLETQGAIKRHCFSAYWRKDINDIRTGGSA